MKTTTKISLAILSMLLSMTLLAQNEVDALRYSRVLFGGSARYMSMGGAFSSLGADFSVLSTNPAGIGVYKKSEMVFTPSVGYTKTGADYLGTYRDDFKYNFNFTNFGMVFAGNVGSSDSEKAEWKGVQFGFGYNRQQNFNGRSYIEGQNDQSTILDVYSSYAQGISFDQLHPFDTELAFNTYLLDTAGGPANYIQAHYGGAKQTKTITTTGGINEMVMSFGGNYNDRFYIGASLGFPFLRYEEISTFKEVDELDSLADFRSLTISDELHTRGTGINFKMGMIYRITDWARISGAFHTPTFYTMTDEYKRSMSSQLEALGNYSDESPVGRYDYNLMTPMRVMGGVAFIIPNLGSVSAEYELIDYSEARLREKNFNGSFTTQNETIRSTYTATNNLRIGTEWIVKPFSIRAGYALYGNPYKSGLNDGSQQFISGGLGIRQQNYFIDFGYVYSLRAEDYYLYSSVPEPASTGETRHQFVCTLGLKF